MCKKSFSIFLMVLGILFFLPVILNSSSDLDYLTVAQREQLLQEGELSSFGKTVSDLRYVPPALRERMQERLGNFVSSIMIESLFFIKNPLKDLPQKTQDLKIVNILRSFSKLEGLHYYSASRQSMRLLFERSYRTVSLSDKTRLEDPLLTKLSPQREEFALLQEDLTFKENMYRSFIEYTGKDFLLENQNETSLWYGLVRLVGPGNFRSMLFVDPHSEGILIYSVSAVRAFNLFGLAESRIESFYTRAKALVTWFEEQINAQ